MKTKNETQSLKAGLIQKFRTADTDRIEAEKLSAKLTARETEERFIAFFGQKPERVEGNKAFFEGVAVQRNCGYGGGWQVIQKCEFCKLDITSTAQSTLENIGKELAKTPRHAHCTGQKPIVPKSTGDQLLELLETFIVENNSCNCD